jgi:hypothetical protein
VSREAEVGLKAALDTAVQEVGVDWTEYLQFAARV